MKNIFSVLQNSLKFRTVLAFLLASLLGVLFHFVYEWTGKQQIAGFFFPVNESTWEHLKLIFFPVMLVAVGEYLFTGKKEPGFFCIQLKSTLLGMAVTVVLFYTYQGVLGKNVDWVNIAIYFIAMLMVYRYQYKKLDEGGEKSHPWLCLLFGILLLFLFMFFSVYPPKLGLFEDPEAAAELR